MNQPVSYNPLAYESISESISRELLAAEAVCLADIERFEGSGIYALFYDGDFPAYGELAEQNRNCPASWPVYVGKAAPSARKGEKMPEEAKVISTYIGTSLYGRMRNHRKSIEAASNLDVRDFSVKLLVLSYIWVPMAETTMISRYRPLWNTVVDGFGNHDPGKGRINGMRSRWDTLHPGRPWASKYPERAESSLDIEQDVRQYLHESLS